ncbi:GNAT family N-acetyltransferase [Microbacterium sp. JZ31]|uniref:GNAT family N-acetyltransferase n=1 Tax=Microbacterium sp. JZ31 TaxID=1906274 RepID=UPI0019344E6B|nr:GNAT family N-acetyltransferase [Microbacterium sp. JZ31]
MPELVAPHPRFHRSFLESHAEWAGATQDGAGIDDEDDVITPAGFERYTTSLVAAEKSPRRPGRVTDTYRWVVEGDEYLGAVSFRHELTDYLLNFAGHVGYGIRPSARGRGLATWALARTADLARRRRYPRILVVCHDRNAASARVIEKNGGVLEDIRRDGDQALRRYWIDLG